MNPSPPWFERKFDFSFPWELLLNLCARLRGTPARLRELLEGRRGEDGHPRHLRQEGQVEDPVVARPVVSGHPGPVEAKDHRQPVEGDVVQHLTPGPYAIGVSTFATVPLFSWLAGRKTLNVVPTPTSE